MPDTLHDPDFRGMERHSENKWYGKNWWSMLLSKEPTLVEGLWEVQDGLGLLFGASLYYNYVQNRCTWLFDVPSEEKLYSFNIGVVFVFVPPLSLIIVGVDNI